MPALGAVLLLWKHYFLNISLAFMIRGKLCLDKAMDMSLFTYCFLKVPKVFFLIAGIFTAVHF